MKRISQNVRNILDKSYQVEDLSKCLVSVLETEDNSYNGISYIRTLAELIYGKTKVLRKDIDKLECDTNFMLSRKENT